MESGAGNRSHLNELRPLPQPADRRRARRILRAGEATLIWITDSHVHSVSVCVKDISQGGIGLVSSEPIPVDHTALVASSDGTGSWGVVRRCTPSKDSYLVGLELISETTRRVR